MGYKGKSISSPLLQADGTQLSAEKGIFPSDYNSANLAKAIRKLRLLGFQAKVIMNRQEGKIDPSLTVSFSIIKKDRKKEVPKWAPKVEDDSTHLEWEQKDWKGFKAIIDAYLHAISISTDTQGVIKTINMQNLHVLKLALNELVGNSPAGIQQYGLNEQYRTNVISNISFAGTASDAFRLTIPCRNANGNNSSRDFSLITEIATKIQASFNGLGISNTITIHAYRGNEANNIPATFNIEIKKINPDLVPSVKKQATDAWPNTLKKDVQKQYHLQYAVLFLSDTNLDKMKDISYFAKTLKTRDRAANRYLPNFSQINKISQCITNNQFEDAVDLLAEITTVYKKLAMTSGSEEKAAEINAMKDALYKFLDQEIDYGIVQFEIGKELDSDKTLPQRLGSLGDLLTRSDEVILHRYTNGTGYAIKPLHDLLIEWREVIINPNKHFSMRMGPQIPPELRAALPETMVTETEKYLKSRVSPISRGIHGMLTGE